MLKLQGVTLRSKSATVQHQETFQKTLFGGCQKMPIFRVVLTISYYRTWLLHSNSTSCILIFNIRNGYIGLTCMIPCRIVWYYLWFPESITLAIVKQNRSTVQLHLFCNIFKTWVRLGNISVEGGINYNSKLLSPNLLGERGHGSVTKVMVYTQKVPGSFSTLQLLHWKVLSRCWERVSLVLGKQLLVLVENTELAA